MERLIRTVVPIIVGTLLARLSEMLVIDIDGEGLIASVTSLTVILYYSAVARAEQRWPQVGWLLGALKTEPTTETPTDG